MDGTRIPNNLSREAMREFILKHSEGTDMKTDFGKLYEMTTPELELLKSNIDSVITRKSMEDKVVVWQLVEADSFVLYCSEDRSDVVNKVVEEAVSRSAYYAPHDYIISVERQYVPKSDLHEYIGDFR